MSLYTQDQKSELGPWHGPRNGLPSYDIPYIHEKVLRIKADALKSFLSSSEKKDRRKLKIQNWVLRRHAEKNV